MVRVPQKGNLNGTASCSQDLGMFRMDNKKKTKTTGVKLSVIGVLGNYSNKIDVQYNAMLYI